MIEGYKARLHNEYWDVKTKYEKLHRMLVKQEAGTLEFTLNCPVDLLKEQQYHMGMYLHCLEVRAEIEGVELFPNTIGIKEGG
jgi:hypothetical protein